MKGFKTNDFHRSIMLMQQSLASLLDESLEIARITLKKSTVRGRTSTTNILRRAFQMCNYRYLSDSSTTERVYQDVNVKQQKASEKLEDFAHSFLNMSSRSGRIERELREISPYLSGLLSTGLPSFEDESLEPIYLDNAGELSDCGSWSPLPDLNRGHPDVC